LVEAESKSGRFNLRMPETNSQMDANRAATETPALELAQAAKNRLNAYWGIGKSGAGTTINSGGEDRFENMTGFACAALKLLKECLEKTKLPAYL